MKIGVITSTYPEYIDDPHGIFVHRLMREIKKQGHDIKVLAPYAGGKSEYEIDGIYVKRFNYFYPKKYQKLCGRSGMIDNFKEGFLVKLQLITFIISNIAHSWIKFRDRDIIHVQWPIPNGAGAFVLRKLHKKPYINTIHGEEIFLSKRYHMIPILKLLVNNSSKSITNSTATLKAGLKVGISSNKLETIPFGVDTNFFRPLKLLKENKHFQILSVGYLIERKGFEYLIKSMSQVVKANPEAILKIVGSGPLENILYELVNVLGLSDNVYILKNVSDQELLKLYNTSDLFVLPSIVDSQGNTEGLGVVLLEAMACGLPVIGSEVGGISDIIDNEETGLLVPQKNENKLADAIKKLMKDDDLRKNLGIKGLNKVKEEFKWSQLASQYIKIYEKFGNVL